MKVLLLFKDRDLDLKSKVPPQEKDLAQDLGLNSIFAAMSHGDKHLETVAAHVVVASLADIEAIEYRQNILKDCLECEVAIRAIYDLCVATIGAERRGMWSGGWHGYPTSNLHRAVETLEMFASKLRQLRAIAEENEASFKSPGLIRFCDMLRRELDDDYLASIRTHLKKLRFRHGVTVSARLGQGNRAIDYVLREDRNTGGWFSQLIGSGPPSYTYRIPERDESGARALSELNDRGINLVANALSQSTDHILSFFHALRDELAFYVGCLNLHHQLAMAEAPICFPSVAEPGVRKHSAKSLQDVGLLLSHAHGIVGNDLSADGKQLVMITGANQGGKSTFLRSIGVAQIMMQCGLFVMAEQFEANVARGVFTHFKREEDVRMDSGKFDEELKRMSSIVDDLRPDSLLLFNESFPATNEREGSEIGRQIVGGVVGHDVKVFFVTHQFELSHGLFSQASHEALFLRAEREEGGVRTFKVVEGEPLRTSFGEDLYGRIFASQGNSITPTMNPAPETLAPTEAAR